MKRHPAVLLCLLLLAATGLLRAQTPAVAAPAPAPTPPPEAAKPAAPQLPPDMTVYYFCLLTRGPNAGTGTREEMAAGQAAHMANIRRLAEEGKILVAGPFMDRGDWRGIFILKCDSLEEAKALVASDPLVQQQRLLADVRPWLTMKGYIRDPEFPTPPTAMTP